MRWLTGHATPTSRLRPRTARKKPPGGAQLPWAAEGGENLEVNNLWEQVGNRCLEHALNLLDEKTAPTAATVETVKGLVDVALSIDMLNLHWARQTRYGAAAFRGQLSSQQGVRN